MSVRYRWTLQVARGALLTAAVCGIAPSARAYAEFPYGWYVKGDNLYVFESDTNGFPASKFLTSSWTNTASMAYDGTSLFAMQAGTLYKVSPSSGSWAALGPTAWAGDALVTWQQKGSRLFIISSGHLHSILQPQVTGDTYQWDLGGGWENSTAITAFGGCLYVIRADTLYRVDLLQGHSVSLGNGWSGATSLIKGDFALAGAPMLYTVQAGYLWSIDAVDGSFNQLSGHNWTGNTSLLFVSEFGQPELGYKNGQFGWLSASGTFTNVTGAGTNAPIVSVGAVIGG